MNPAADRLGFTTRRRFSARKVITLLFFLVQMVRPLQSQTDLDNQRRVEAHALSAQHYLAEGKPELALSELDAIISLDPKNIVARGNLGVLLFFRGDYAGAVPHLRVALELKPNLWKIQALLGISEMRVGEDSAGRNDLAAAFPNLTDKKIQIDVGNDLITSYSSTGDLDKAAEIISAMLSVSPKDAKLLYTAFRVYSDLSSQAVLTMAMMAPDSDEMRQAAVHELAEHLMAQKLAKHPDSAEVAEQLRLSLIANPQPPRPDSNNYLSTASDPTKLDSNSLFKVYRLYSDLIDQTILQLATCSPNTPEIYQAVAHILAKQGFSTAAIASYHQALKLSPNNPNLHFELGEMLYTSDSPTLQAQAEAEYNAALIEDPNQEKAQVRLGEIAAKSGDTKTAYADYSHAFDLQPKDAEAAMGLASALKRMGQSEKALALMERAVELDPTNAGSHYRLGLLYRDARRTEDAKREIAEYKKYKIMKDNLGELLRKLRIAEQLKPNQSF
jgi:tetratricopeptide (TPR) repeat protein